MDQAPAMGNPSQASYNATEEREVLVQRSTPKLVTIGKCALIASLCFLLFAYITIVSIILVSSWRPSPPSFDINYFSVSNFNPSVPGFTGNWIANLTAKNKGAKMYMDRTECSVYYFKDGILGYDKHLLGSAVLQPFYIEKMASIPIQANVSIKETDIAKLETNVIDEMAEKKRSGTMDFSFEMLYFITQETEEGRSHKSYQYWYHCLMNVVFEDDATGNGNANYGELIDCNHFQNLLF